MLPRPLLHLQWLLSFACFLAFLQKLSKDKKKKSLDVQNTCKEYTAFFRNILHYMIAWENKFKYHQNEDVVELGSAVDLVVGPVK